MNTISKKTWISKVRVEDIPTLGLAANAQPVDVEIVRVPAEPAPEISPRQLAVILNRLTTINAQLGRVEMLVQSLRETIAAARHALSSGA